MTRAPRSSRPWLRALALFALLLIVLAAAVALARPGGGSSFSGGGGSGGSGGGDDGVILEIILWLCFEHPVVGVPLLVGFLAYVIITKSRQRKGREWSTAAVAEHRGARPGPAVSRTSLARLQSVDPEFSLVLFEDFLYMLYAELLRARGSGRVEELSAYLTPEAQAQLRGAGTIAEVKGIVIGSMRLLQLAGLEAGTPRLDVELEANCVEVAVGGKEQRLYVKDQLSLWRGAGVVSRPPARARTLDCPSCGAPLQSVRGGQCSYCQMQVSGGRFDWTVDGFSRLSCEPRGPLLTSNVHEQGTHLPTIIDRGAQARLSELKARDPAFSWATLQGRVSTIFGELQLGWSSRDWMRVRPFVSDNLFQSQMYWIDLYRQARARNVTEGACIERIVLANVISDKHYDAITLRVFATGLDYTVSDEGKLLSGSRTRKRPYSEYWTLIRGAQRTGQSRGDLVCPNCGAPLKINMAGTCEYCQAKVTSGEFDWVLSRIEQDETYAG